MTDVDPQALLGQIECRWCGATDDPRCPALCIADEDHDKAHIVTAEDGARLAAALIEARSERDEARERSALFRAALSPPEAPKVDNYQSPTSSPRVSSCDGIGDAGAHDATGDQAGQ
jgi:hypothetical protein